MKTILYQTACIGILFVYGILEILNQAAAGSTILCLLLTAAAAFGSSLPERSWPPVLIALACAVLYCLFPAGLFFIPLVLFEPFRRRLYPAALFFLPALILGSPGAAAVGRILTLCAASLLLSIGTAVYTSQRQTIQDIRDTAAEHRMDLERRNKALQKQQDTEIYTATLKERNRIAREIHDNVGHILSRSIIMTGALSTINTDEKMKEPLQLLEAQLNQAMTSIRESVHDLHDDSMDLKEASEMLIRDFTACPADLNYEMSRIVPKNVRYCFLAVLKEALTNVARHSDATQVKVQMIEHQAIYQMAVQDNGTVTGRRRPEQTGQGIGLQNMRDRVQALGGTVHITQDCGFRIFISVPKKQTNHDPEEK